MDLDRDGRADVLTGSYAPGEIFLFAGLEPGGFSAPRALADTSGKHLRVGRASWPFACDWDGDGDLDLLIGNMAGSVFLARNASGGKALELAAPAPLVVGGEPLVIDDTNACPSVADWDGDGARDLLLGTGNGRVLFFRNARTQGEPELAAAREIVAKSPDGDARERLKHPGRRARVSVCDWNEDGRLDLVVGEYASEDATPPVLSADEEVELSEAMHASLEVGKHRAELERKALAAWLERKGIPADQAAELYDDFLVDWLQTDEARAVVASQDEVTAVLHRLNPTLIEHGRVWLFLRKPSGG